MPGFLSRMFGRQPRFTLVFLHIPKTAGISLREILLKRRSPSFRIIHPIDDHQRLADQSAEFRGSLELVEGHLYYGVHEVLPRPCVYLTMLRDPAERVLSYYSFIREYEPHHLYQQARRLSLGECFARGLTVELDNFMVRCLTSLRNIHVPFGGVTRQMLAEAKAHLESIEAIGLTEEFDASVALFSRRFAWDRADIPRLNATQKRVRAAELSAAESAAIREHNVLDQELYDFGRELFRARSGQRR